MDSLPETPLLDFPPNLITNVRKVYNLDQPGRMAEAVDILDEWVKKQPHFMKKDFTRCYLENTIVASKGSLERAKSRMDKLCTFKTLMPKLFEMTNIQEVDSFRTVLTISVLPQLTKDNYRTLFVKMKNTDYQPSDFAKFSNSIFCILEYLRLCDYALGYILIFDLTDINVTDLIAKLILTDLQQMVTVIIEGFGARIKNVFFLTPSKLVDGFVKLIKPFVSEKISKRLEVCRTVDDLCRFVPREILPMEYGGNARSTNEIAEHWIDILSTEEYVKIFDDLKHARTNEAYRQIDQLNEQYLGIPGTFRTLSVD